MSPALFAVDRDLRIDQMHHTAWTADDAGIGEIRQVAQTSDGFLWLVTSTAHLLRFDGLHFEPIETALAGKLPADDRMWNDIYSIDAVPGGGLWIEHGASLRLDLLRNGSIKSFTVKDGLPTIPIERMVQDQDGILWIATAEGLGRLQDLHCAVVAGGWGYSGGRPADLFIDRSGTVWVKSHDGRLFFLNHGSRTFQINKSGSGKPEVDGYLAQAPDGTIWQSGFGGVEQVLLGTDDRPGNHVYLIEPHSEVQNILFDRDGALWFHLIDGIHRIPHPQRIRLPRKSPAAQEKAILPVARATPNFDNDAFTSKNGLSSNSIWCFQQDREGNIWVGTRNGLDRFSNNVVIQVPLPPTPQGQFALAAGTHGSVWAADWDPPLFKIEDRVQGSYKFSGNISTVYCDPAGVVWVGKLGKSLWHSTGSGFVSVGWPPGREQDYIKSMAMDREGGLWVSLATQGIFRFANGVWTNENQRLKIPSNSIVQAISVDENGRVWFNTGKLTELDRSNVQNFGERNGILRGYATALQARGQHTWMGGLFGLALFTNGHFQAIKGIGDEAFGGLTGIIELSDGDLWFNTSEGVVLISASEIQHAIREPGYRVSFRRFDALDGLVGKATYWIPVPTAALGTNGRLWFSTSRGVFWVDPERLARNRNSVPPPVFVNSVTSNGKQFAIVDTVQLPVHTSSLQIDYTALSLTLAERVRFRYMLGSVDRQWQDAGTRRQAFYTNLSPGAYHFRVIACNNDGVWNETGAVINFVIAPAWYQTLWFKCLAALALLGALWSLYALRLAWATAEINERLGERMKERERIARELHDTLLQGFQGIMLRFQAVQKQIPSDLQAHRAMEETLNRADGVLIEGRQRVRDLRFDSFSETDVARVLELCGQELAQDHEISFSVSTVGVARVLQPMARDQVLQIGREAIVNAFMHSHASRIEVEVIYAPTEFQLRVRDDGIGIGSDVVKAGLAGHWGLPGMRERASEIGAHLDIWGSKGAGVEIDLRVPGKIAYVPVRERRSILRFAKFRR
jgi:ligand-binding sensor domain-containing protein